MGKLEFLRDENNVLEDKLTMKDQQLKTAENKFSETHNPGNIKKNESLKRIKTQKYI